jgi:peptide/nickel transport system substrate-binding protein
MNTEGRNRGPWAVALALALLLAACRGPGAAGPSRLVLGQPNSALTLDPHLHDEESTYCTLEHFYDRLVAFGPDMELVPELALTWQNPSDTLWRIRLRHGVVFHDGRPFGAEDVAASIRRARALPGSRVAYYLESVADVRATDSETLEIVTALPSPILLNKLAFIGIVPRDTPLSPITRPIGTGPFRFLSGTPGKAIEGKRFDRYWGPAPAWESVRFVSLPDARSRAEAVSSGAADAVLRFPIDWAEWGSRQRTMKLVSVRGLVVTLLGFDTKPPSPFADLRVRKALAVAIDRASLLPEAERSHSIPISQFVPAGVFGHIPGTTTARPDVAEANRLLSEAGFPLQSDTRLTFADTHADVGRALVRQLGAAGIRVIPDPLPQAELYARFSTDTPSLFLMSWAAGTGDGSDVLEALFHTPAGGLGAANRFGYSRPELDDLVARAARTLDPASRRDALWAAFRLLAEDLPAVPLLLRSSLYAIRPDLEWTQRRNRRLRAADLEPGEL